MDDVAIGTRTVLEIDAKVWGGYLIRCACRHAFVTKTTCSMIECPQCGSRVPRKHLRVSGKLQRCALQLPEIAED